MTIATKDGVTLARHTPIMRVILQIAGRCREGSSANMDRTQMPPRVSSFPHHPISLSISFSARASHSMSIFDRYPSPACVHPIRAMG